MAAANFITKLEDKYCTCPICYSKHTTPKVLPCRHTFCKECLQNHIHATALKKPRGFSCPYCREFIRIPRPGKAIKNWAEQFKDDFILSELQIDFKAYEPDDTVEKAEIPLHTEHCPQPAINHLPLTITKTPDRGSSGEPKCVSSKPTVSKLTGELVSIFSIEDESSIKTYACDLVVLEQKGLQILATLDFERNRLTALQLDSGMKVSSRRYLDLGLPPWRICKVKNNEVAVTVNQPNCILICIINDDAIEVVRRISTTKNYDGIAILCEGFVATTRDNVDILKEDGSIHREHVVQSRNTKFTYNSYVNVTSDDIIVVTDSEGKSVSWVTPEGHIQWQRPGNFSGVTSISNGIIFVSDIVDGIVYQFFRGRKMSKVAETSRPSGIAADEDGHLYVISDYKNIGVYKLLPSVT